MTPSPDAPTTDQGAQQQQQQTQGVKPPFMTTPEQLRDGSTETVRSTSMEVPPQPACLLWHAAVQQARQGKLPQQRLQQPSSGHSSTSAGPTWQPASMLSTFGWMGRTLSTSQQ